LHRKKEDHGLVCRIKRRRRKTPHGKNKEE
jgi:hypothetical protein